MRSESLFRTIGLALLGGLAGCLFVAIAYLNDQKRVVGFDPELSLVATCGPGTASFFTNRERLAVYMERADGRVAAQPVYRGGEVTGLHCEPTDGILLIDGERGQRRIALAPARGRAQALALTP